MTAPPDCATGGWEQYDGGRAGYPSGRRGGPAAAAPTPGHHDSDGGVDTMSAHDSQATPLPGDPGLPVAQRLAGKVAIVTGAGSRPAGPDGPIVGNGRATAIVLAREGAKVVLVDERRDWAEATLDMIERDGGEAVLVETDVTSSESCKRAVDRALEAFGGLNILINNVGVTGPPGNAVEV